MSQDARAAVLYAWTNSDYYAALDVGPRSSNSFAVWGVAATLDFQGGNRTMFCNADPSLGTANGFYEIEFDNFALRAVVVDSVGFKIATTVSFGSIYPENLKCFTAMMTVNNKFVDLWLNGKQVTPSVAVVDPITPMDVGNRFVIGNRSDLTCAFSGGILGVGGMEGAVPTDLEILDWHLRCVDYAGIAEMAGESHRWDSRDQSPPTASWVDRVAGQAVAKAGSPLATVHVPVWL